MIVKEEKKISILTPELDKKTKDFRHKLGIMKAGYPLLLNWNGSEADEWDIFPHIPVEKSVVYYGNDEYAYSHHQTICRFKDKLVVSWSNGFRHEDHYGQQVHYSWSSDAVYWEPYSVLARTSYNGSEAAGTVRNNAGLLAHGEKLYAYIGVCESRGNTGMGMNHMAPKKMTLDVYETGDLAEWKHNESIADDIYLFEAPRPTLNEDLLCCGFDINDWQQGLVLLWKKGSDPAGSPEMIKLPRSREGIIPEQGTWYQQDDGRIYLFLRDGSLSMKLALSISEDGGRTWSEPVRTDFPNTYSRAYSGRCDRDFYYIVGNNYDHYLDRSSLMIAVSKDGEVFDKMQIILDTPTTRRIDGYHKENGFHYPNCLSEDGKIYTVCSENKEDIVVAVIDSRYLI